MIKIVLLALIYAVFAGLPSAQDHDSVQASDAGRKARVTASTDIG